MVLPKKMASKMLLDAKVTRYTHARDNVGQEATFADFLRDCLSVRERIERLRALPEDDKDAIASIKGTLPGYTLSGVFAPTRAKANLQKHSGLICLDIDHVANCGELMTDIARLNIVAYVSRSASGRGVFVVVPLAYPNRHTEQWEALRRYFKSRFNVEVDKQTKDTTRLRFVSYDADAIINLEAQAFEGLFIEPTAPTQRIKKYMGYDLTEQTVSDLCKEIVSRRIDITNGYTEWFKVGMSLADMGERGREYFHAVSSICPKYNRELADRKFDNFLKSRSRISIASFIGICRDVLCK